MHKARWKDSLRDEDEDGFSCSSRKLTASVSASEPMGGEDAEDEDLDLDPEQQKTAWNNLVRDCALAAGRLEKNMKAYIGNAVSNRQLAALGEENTLALLKLCVPDLPDQSRKTVSSLLRVAKDMIESKDNGSKAAFSAVNEVYGTSAKFFVSKPSIRPAPRSQSSTAKGVTKKKDKSKKRKAPVNEQPDVRVAKGALSTDFTFAKQARSYDSVSAATMEGDDRRMAFYREALFRVAEGKVVLDIGTGDHGILAQIAIEAGAKHVYAVEIREAASKNAQKTLDKLFPGKATVFHRDLAKLTHRDKDVLDALGQVEVVVHEVFGTIASEEGIVQIFSNLLQTRRDLGGPVDVISVPQAAETLIAPVTRPTLKGASRNNADLDEGEVQLWQGYASAENAAESRFDEPQSVELIKFDQCPTLPNVWQSAESVFYAQRGGQWNGLHLQLRLKSGRDVTSLTSGGETTNWEDVYVTVPPPLGCENWCGGRNVACPCMVKTGERIALKMRSDYLEDSCRYTISIAEPKRFANEVVFTSAELHAIQLG